MFSFSHKQNVSAIAGLCVFAFAALFAAREMINNGNGPDSHSSYIVQGLSLSKMAQLIEKVDGEVSHTLPIINAIGVSLTPVQLEILAAHSVLKISPNKKVISHNALLNQELELLPSYATETFITEQTGASLLHEKGITGEGVGIAIIDSGLSAKYERGSYLRLSGEGRTRLIAKYDALLGDKSQELDDDFNGHGSHVGGVTASSVKDENGNFNGMAPDANLISIRAFDQQGQGSYLDVIAGIDWMVKNKDKLRVKVANLSFGAAVQSPYWEDPLNQAVMRAWEAGIVVVTSAGNQGPVPMTITAPGNVPYVITVGAVTDNYTAADFSDDRMTTFSSQGPTVEGFVKPELVSWGGHVVGKINAANIPDISSRYDLIEQGEDYYMISGTSQAAAVITGTVALMLQLEPHMSPDDVKCRLMATARPAVTTDGKLAYSPFVQGAGLSNAMDAVLSHESGCANTGLDISADVAGFEHFQGPTRVDELGNLYITGESERNWLDGASLKEGTSWLDTANDTQGHSWSNGAAWVKGVSWNKGTRWEKTREMRQGDNWQAQTVKLQNGHQH